MSRPLRTSVLGVPEAWAPLPSILSFFFFLSYSPSLLCPILPILTEHAFFCVWHIKINPHKTPRDLFYTLHSTDSKTEVWKC